MTQQAADSTATGRSSVHISHAAVVTTRMPTLRDRAAGYPPDMPLLVVEGRDGQEEQVFSGDLTTVVFGDPDGGRPPVVPREAAAARHVLAAGS